MLWNELKNASLDELIAWAEPQPWAQDMAQCVQDAEWHAEGDVWTHTKMVLDQLPLLECWSDLTQEQRTILAFTALFHDAAKPQTTEIDEATGHIRTPKHAVKGEHLARAVLRDLECDLNVREQIARHVRFHGRPVFLTEREDPVAEVVKLSWLLSNELLYWFAVADTRGRDTDSMTRPEENLQLWQMMAVEHDCYQEPYPFASEACEISLLSNC